MIINMDLYFNKFVLHSKLMITTIIDFTIVTFTLLFLYTKLFFYVN